MFRNDVIKTREEKKKIRCSGDENPIFSLAILLIYLKIFAFHKKNCFHYSILVIISVLQYILHRENNAFKSVLSS